MRLITTMRWNSWSGATTASDFLDTSLRTTRSSVTSWNEKQRIYHHNFWSIMAMLNVGFLSCSTLLLSCANLVQVYPFFFAISWKLIVVRLFNYCSWFLLNFLLLNKLKINKVESMIWYDNYKPKVLNLTKLSVSIFWNFCVYFLDSKPTYQTSQVAIL